MKREHIRKLRHVKTVTGVASVINEVARTESRRALFRYTPHVKRAMARVGGSPYDLLELWKDRHHGS